MDLKMSSENGGPFHRGFDVFKNAVDNEAFGILIL